MLSSIQLQNLRSFGTSGALPLRPLTIIVGPNNAGKSTILDSLLLLRQTLNDPSYLPAFVTAGSLIDMGGFDDLIRGGAEAADRTITISLSIPDVVADSWPVPTTRSNTPPPPPATALTAAFTLDPNTSQIRLCAAEFSRDSDTILEIAWSDEADALVVRAPAAFTMCPVSPYNFIPDLGLPEQPPDDPDTAFRYIDAVAVSSIRAQQWHKLIDGVGHISPVRRPIPHMTIAGRTAATRGEAEGENLVRLLSISQAKTPTGRPLLEAVAYWMTERFGMLASLHPQKIDRTGRVLALTADDREGFPNTNVANMGEGISQLLPVVSSVVMTLPGDALLVEQPELHLHPAAQAALGDLFVESITDLHGPQFIVETHSEHLLLRIRRRIAENVISPDLVSVLYISKADGESRVSRLELTQEGNFMDWPPGFFEEGYNEALDLARANAK
jgi:predicted ATPase